MRRMSGTAVLAILAPTLAFAVITFSKLDDHTFTVSHAVKWVGGRGAAMSKAGMTDAQIKAACSEGG